MGKAIAVGHLTQALHTRELIGQARRVRELPLRRAAAGRLRYLTRTSQNSNVELRDVAAQIVAETYQDPAHAR